MNAAIYSTHYKNVPAIAMETEACLVRILPEHGAKVASIVLKKTGREFLVQAPNEAYLPLDRDGSYVDAECSGFDDMFPTIDPCSYHSGPYQGIPMPDHGEVCRQRWDCEVLESSGCLHCWTVSSRFSYRLDKWLRFETDHHLQIQYIATNYSPYDLDFIWAAHIMINAEQGAEISLPGLQHTSATCVFSSDPAFSKPGQTISWPLTKKIDGQMMNLRQTAPKSLLGNSYKYYFNEALHHGECAYRYPDQTKIEITFPVDVVPYLGIWVNEGSFKEYYNIALEPCTGTFDDPFRAAIHKQNSVLPGSSEYSWSLAIHVE